MNYLHFVNASYSDSNTDGTYAVVLPNVGIRLNGTVMALPSVGNLLQLRIAPNGTHIAGIGHDDQAWFWNGSAWSSHGLAFGPNSVIFDLANTLHVHRGPAPSGYRFVAPDGEIWPCQSDNPARDTYADNPVSQSQFIYEWTQQGDIYIGQGGNGPHGEDPAIALYQGKRYVLGEGTCRFIRFNRSGDKLSVAWVNQHNNTATILWLTTAELQTFPEQQTEEPPSEEDDDPPIATIASYTPTNGDAPLTVTATMTVDDQSGPIDLVTWRWRQGAGMWHAEAGTLEPPTHTFTFTAPGTYAIGLDVSGPGGTDSTGRDRLVDVRDPEPLEPPKEAPVLTPLSEPYFLNWRYGGGQSLDPPTNPDDPNRDPFEHGRETAGGDEHAQLVKLADGTYAVKSPNGRAWLSIQPDASYEERPVVEGQEPGPWERFTLKGNVLTELAKDGITRPPVAFVQP